MPASWSPIYAPVSVNAGTMLLLTDGSILIHDSGPALGGSANWWKLTPNRLGQYEHGSWALLKASPNSPLFFASAVLADGRVFVAGGEYDAGQQVELAAAQIYDPVTDLWHVVPPPDNWGHIGDAPCCVLPDGRILLGSIDDLRTAIFDPTSNSWQAGPNKNDRSSEETWTLLPDGSVLAIQCTNHPRTERYVPAPPGGSPQWVDDSPTPPGADLVDALSIEVGPAVLCSKDGRVFAVGATGHTALYTPPIPGAAGPGNWTAGPDLPADPIRGGLMQAKDAPACLLPNGDVLFTAGPAAAGEDDYPGPTSFFQFNGTALTPVADPPPDAGGPVTVAPFGCRMLLLPTGQVLVSEGTSRLLVYTPGGTAVAGSQPSITTGPSGPVNRGQTYTLLGQRFNGPSQAVAYGDDASAATNYPLVRLISPNGRVWYCRTFNHDSMGVATGARFVRTSFRVPDDVEPGTLDLYVVANGVPSARQSVVVQ